MKSMKNFNVSRQVEKKIKRGQSLLLKEDIPNPPLMDDIVQLYSSNGNRLGTAYLSYQNKGIGWFLSPQTIHFDQPFVENLFRQSRSKRQSYENDELTTAYRLFNQEGDGLLGVTVDRYGDYAVFSWYNAFIYDRRDMIVQAFQAVYPDILGATEKIRFKGLDYESAHLYGEEAPEVFTILENGVQYQVFLNDGLMTGIFLDQHEVRASLVDGLAAGKNLLNMFSYTAAFSVAATMGGASETTSVDLAKRSRELSEAHFLANGFPLENHRFIVMDVFQYFKYAKRHDLSYDVIILDPPSFARNKKETFSVAKDYHRLISGAVEILNPNGILIASTNASNVSKEKFKKQIEKGFAGTSHTYLQEYGLPADFVYKKNEEGSNYLKVFTIKVNE